MHTAMAIFDFWFQDAGPKNWYKKSDQFDAEIKDKYESVLKQVVAGEKAHWRRDPKTSLAEVIVLDQFSRNIYRGLPASFAQDSLALALAQFAIMQNFDSHMPPDQKAFLYMPFMHSESPLIQQKALELFSAEGLEKNLDFAIKHKVIIDRFGRFPHRNHILGRVSTPEEIEFLKQPGSSF